MTNYKKILRLRSLGIKNAQITEACGCLHTTVVSVLGKAENARLKSILSKKLGQEYDELLGNPHLIAKGIVGKFCMAGVKTPAIQNLN